MNVNDFFNEEISSAPVDYKKSHAQYSHCKSILIDLFSVTVNQTT